MVNARLQKSFLKNQLSCTLYANDIFRTARTKVTAYYAIGLTDQNIYTLRLHYQQGLQQ